MTRTLIEELEVGSRRVAGTDRPVVDQLWRTGPRSWEIVRELCSGVPRRSETFATEDSAREAFASRIEGRKPDGAALKAARITIRIESDLAERIDIAASEAGLDRSAWLTKAAEAALARSRTR
jgi:hypothetical protein